MTDTSPEAAVRVANAVQAYSGAIPRDRAYEMILAQAARIAELRDVMAEYLPILDALESSGQWDRFAKTTGIATVNRYRATLQGEAS